MSFGASSCRRSICANAATCSASAPTSSAPGTRRSRRASATARCGRAVAASAARSCRSSRACRRPARTPTSGCRCSPGTEGVLALGLAHVIMARQACGPPTRRPRRRAHRRLGDGLPDYTPDAVEQLTGVAATRVERLAREFADERPAVAIIGGPPLAHTNGLFTRAGGQRAERAAGQRRAAGRHLLHAAASA